MKVEKKSVSSASYASASAAYGSAKRVDRVAARDDLVEVSASGQLFETAVRSAANVPDVRTEAISGIQQEFANGTYQRDERVVAEKMIQDTIDTPI